jgi:hypothetical protein
MRKEKLSTIVLTVVFFLAGSVCEYSLAVAGQGRPPENKETEGKGTSKIYFPEMTFDFGTVSQQGSYSHKFTVRNIGDSPLKLIRAKGS